MDETYFEIATNRIHGEIPKGMQDAGKGMEIIP